MVAEALTIMPNSDYWINFAKEEKITPLGSEYVFRESLCNEENLLNLLKEIWEIIFN